MYRDCEDNSWRPQLAECRTSRASRHSLHLPSCCQFYDDSWVISFPLPYSAQKLYSQAYFYVNQREKIPKGYFDQLLKNLSSKTSKITLIIAQIPKFSILKTNILSNSVRPVGILEKRSNRPPGSGTKNFVGPIFQKQWKIQRFLLKNCQIWPFWPNLTRAKHWTLTSKLLIQPKNLFP